MYSKLFQSHNFFMILQHIYSDIFTLTKKKFEKSQDLYFCLLSSRLQLTKDTGKVLFQWRPRLRPRKYDLGYCCILWVIKTNNSTQPDAWKSFVAGGSAGAIEGMVTVSSFFLLSILQFTNNQ